MCINNYERSIREMYGQNIGDVRLPGNTKGMEYDSVFISGYYQADERFGGAGE
jgi:hypothetical protein